MTENDFLQLVRRWQDAGTWQRVQKLARYADELQSQANQLGADARLMLDRGDIAQARTLKAEADHLWKCAASDSELLEELTGEKCAASVREQRTKLIDEFMRLESWVREHRPELLEFLPMPKFEGDPSEAIRDLKRLESRIRKPAAEKPGPEFYKRTDGKASYFKVWEFVQKPGNAKKLPAEIVRATKVSKNRVPEILSKTRPPTSEEIEQRRTTSKKR